jgi:hypothetical protein
MLEDFVAKACASCGKQFKPKAAQHKMCDGCFNRPDKKTPKLSSADTSVTMTPAAKESFNQRRKFKSVKKNAKRWSQQGFKKGDSSSSSGPLSKKDKTGAVHMLTAFNDEGSTEHTSKKARLVSPAVADESDNDPELAGAASSSKQGGVMPCSKSDDKEDPRDSTKVRLKARGPRFAPVPRPEGSRDFYDAHLCCEYEYTGAFKKTSEPVSATKPSPVTNKKVHRKKLAGKDEKVEETTTSSDNEGSTERPAKKPRASSASVMHVQPLRSYDDDGHELLLSTLTGGHGDFMLAKTEVDKIEDWYDPDNGWYNSDNNWEAPLFNLHVDASITGGRGALFFDSFDQVVWAYDTTAEITSPFQAQAAISSASLLSLLLGAMLSGSSRNSIARTSGLISLTSPVSPLATPPTTTSTVWSSSQRRLLWWAGFRLLSIRTSSL